MIAMKASKRRKLQHDSKATEIPSTPADEHPQQNLRLDDLQWEQVKLPDQLDDYEGFFGLEEIDDVEVLRDGDNGKVSYKPARKRAQQADRKEARTWEPKPIKAQEIVLKLDVVGEEEWSGLQDATEDSSPSTHEEGTLQKGGEGTARQRKHGTSRKKNRLTGLGFASLPEEALDDGADTSAWESLHLSGECLASLSRLRLRRPTPIQTAAIPEILAGHDVIGKAQTGSGKTLAFGIPILEYYLEHLRGKSPSRGDQDDSQLRRPPAALILSPTRELAHQIAAHLKDLCTSENFKQPTIATVTGGLSVQKQQRFLVNADIIIGTPGRLWEVIGSSNGLLPLLQMVKYLILDEADRVLSEGHFKEVEEILNALDRADEDGAQSGREDRQTLVFSATFHKGLQQKLAGRARHGGDLINKNESMDYLLKKLNFRKQKPKFVDVDPVSQMASDLREALIECAGTEKDLFLYAVLLYQPNLRTLIFTNSISSVRRITPLLTNLHLRALPLHSHMPQKARLRSLERFTAEGGAVLVATDVAARGLDIRNVELVIHYHVPRTADMYVHRSGRTARAENSGTSILLCAPEEVAGVRRLITKVHAPHQDGHSRKSSHDIRTVELDRKVVARLKPRVTLAKTIADTTIAKEKSNSKDDFFKKAAEDLGVEYDSEELEKQATGRRGRGEVRKKKQRQAAAATKGEVSSLKAQLKGLLSQRVNVGVSTKYITSADVDIAALLEGKGNKDFLGPVSGLDLD